MSDEHEKKPLHKETFFLPPLNMYLAFCDKDAQQEEKDTKVTNPEKTTEKDLEKLIEKLSEKEE